MMFAACGKMESEKGSEEKHFHLQLSCRHSGRTINIQLKWEAYQLADRIYHRTTDDNELMLNYDKSRSREHK